MNTEELNILHNTFKNAMRGIKENYTHANNLDAITELDEELIQVLNVIKLKDKYTDESLMYTQNYMFDIINFYINNSTTDLTIK